MITWEAIQPHADVGPLIIASGTLPDGNFWTFTSWMHTKHEHELELRLRQLQAEVEAKVLEIWWKS